MKQVLANLRDGSIAVADVPAPAVRPGHVLVANEASLISAGTESGTVQLGAMNPLAKARARPEQALKVIDVALRQGPLTAWDVAQNALDMPVALGYSSAGVVIDVGDGVVDVRRGDRVACAGQGYASHAELVSVPHRLCVRHPESLTAEQAAFGGVGAIALQSVRIGEVQLGDRVAVIGLGLVGLLVAQLARAAGAHVIGVDVDDARIALLEANGWGSGVRADANPLAAVMGATAGHGADAVIVTASSADNAPLTLAGEMARRRGRVVIVGRTDISVPRESYLFKELSLRGSMSFGPGAGDPGFEERGHDYPYAYVRYTEQRNIAAFLEQVAAGRVDVAPLISARHPASDAAAAFAALSARGPRPIGVMLRYAEPGAAAPAAPPARRVDFARAPARDGRPRIGVIGAGNFASVELLPVLARLDCTLHGIASATGVRAASAGDRLGFAYATSDPREVIDDPAHDAILVLTRHDTHAEFAAAALAAGKHVLVEKPLCMRLDELDAVRAAVDASGRALMVGFNRRYAPFALDAARSLKGRTQPLFVRYTANVGARPPEHWLHDARSGGGVIVGEACHHIDFCSWLIGARAVDWTVRTLGGRDRGVLPEDNVQITITYDDGSLAALSYMSVGQRRFPGETIEVMGGGRHFELRDFRALRIARPWWMQTRRHWLRTDRGHRGQLQAFLDGVRSGRPAWSVESYLASSELTLRIAADVDACVRGKA